MSVEAVQLSPTALAVFEVVDFSPAGTLGGDAVPDPGVWNVATAAYQSVELLNVARAS